MTKDSLNKIIGIVHDIKHFDQVLHSTQAWDDKVGDLVRFQDEHSKAELVKDLIIELLRSGVGFREIEGFLAKLTTYLSTHDAGGEPLSPVIKASLQELERLVVAA